MKKITKFQNQHNPDQADPQTSDCSSISIVTFHIIDPDQSLSNRTII